ncbi:MAG TPA: hypothetical protein VGB73_05560 [Pyrinomonadaceae bacterium]|jgi:hypothetical protein
MMYENDRRDRRKDEGRMMMIALIVHRPSSIVQRPLQERFEG